MKYLSVKETAGKWNLSERRVRALISAGRITGAVKQGKSYLIPDDAKKPVDKRYAGPDAVLWLKWKDSVIGTIDPEYNVYFEKPDFNRTVSTYTKGKSFWNRGEFEEFLSDRLISPQRRDIDHILLKLGFSHYNIMQLAVATHAINSKDLLWIAQRPGDRLKDVVSAVFDSIFARKEDMTGDSVDSPEGYNIKRYGVYKGKYGIYKNRLHPLATDAESEIAVYGIAKLIGVDCCPAYRTGDDTVFSEFCYDISSEYIVHFRRFFEAERSDNEYFNLLSVRPQYQKEIIKMLVLDFICRQDDRHLSNIAVKIQGDTESFYPLYDNGRSLFYEDTPETVGKAVKDICGFATAFGPSGTYYDILSQISQSGVVFSKLVDLDFTKAQINAILKKAGFAGYRLKGAAAWIMAAADILKKMDK